MILTKSSVRNYTKPLIFTSIAFIVVLLVILGFNTFQGDKPQTEPNSNDNLIFESNKPDLPKVDLTRFLYAKNFYNWTCG